MNIDSILDVLEKLSKNSPKLHENVVRITSERAQMLKSLTLKYQSEIKEFEFFMYGMAKENNIEISDIQYTLKGPHYSPKDKVINIDIRLFSKSKERLYAIGAHEMGHAIQFNTLILGSKTLTGILHNLSAFLLKYFRKTFGLLLLFVIFTALGLMYLPTVISSIIISAAAFIFLIEFDASRRARQVMKKTKMWSRTALMSLFWALMTYTLMAFTDVFWLFLVMMYPTILVLLASSILILFIRHKIGVKVQKNFTEGLEGTFATDLSDVLKELVPKKDDVSQGIS